MSTKEENQKDKQEKERRERSVAEIVVTVLNAGVFLFLVGYSIYHGIVTPGTPPRLSAVPLVDEVIERDEKYVLPVLIENRSRPTVQDVRVEVFTSAPGAEEERKEITIRYLPEHSSVRGFAILDGDPRDLQVTASIESYRMP